MSARWSRCTCRSELFRNPLMMAAWGLFVAVTLVIGSLPFFVGLAVVLPVLAHSSWHLYRKVVEPDLSSRLDRDRFPWTHGDGP